MLMALFIKKTPAMIRRR